MKKYLRSPAELRGRLLQKALCKAEQIAPSIFLRPAGEHAHANRGLVLQNHERSAIRTALAGTSARSRLVKHSVAVENGDVPIFGLGYTQVGIPPRWHHEPVANLEAPRAHWSTIPYLDPAIIGDHKVLWEFNRHQYLVGVAQAWLLTQDEKWANLIAEHLRSWLRENPAGQGVNWASSLEVAYRAIAWCWVIRLAGDAPQVRSMLPELTRSIDAHGRHVYRYLSTWFSPNTHLTGEALGLLYIATFFPELKRARELHSAACNILESQLFVQVHPDGVYFEQATQYHRYTAEIYLHYLLLKKWRGEPVRAEVVNRAQLLFVVLQHLTRSDGSMPLVGDDDGGLLLPLDEHPPHILNGLLRAGALFFDDCGLASGITRDDEMAVWLLGPDFQHGSSGTVATEETAPETSRVFREGGLVVMRDQWRAPSGHAVFDAGPHGALACGHSHADALAIELFAASGPLFVDSGTYTYVGAERNTFRSSAAHNTVTIDDGSSIPAPAPFRWSHVTNGAIDEFAARDGVSWAAGSIQSAPPGASEATHHRSLLHPEQGVWIVIDRIELRESARFQVAWHVDPEVTPSISAAAPPGVTLEFSRSGNHVATAIICSSAPGEAAVVSHHVSRRFGAKERSSSCMWAGVASGDVSLHTIVIDWVIVPEATVEVICDDGVSFTLRNPVPRLPGNHRLSLMLNRTDTAAPRVHLESHDEKGSLTVLAGPGLVVRRAQEGQG